MLFCPYCGSKQEIPKVYCGYCGAEMDHDAVYCNSCGKKSFFFQQKEEDEIRIRQTRERKEEDDRLLLTEEKEGKSVTETAVPVDLGLPSGTKWADRDVIGFYSWGEIQDKEEEGFNVENYVHCDGDLNSMHRIGSNICGTQFDVAHVKWGEKWRMPTIEQIEELMDNCTFELVGGCDFFKATSKINGNHLLFRIVGIGYGEEFIDGVIYWSGNIGMRDSRAMCLYLSGDADSESVETSEEDRFLGGTIRAVLTR